MKYLNHWKIEQSPFLGPQSTLYVGGSVEEAVARLGFLIENQRQLGMLVGPTGVGKSVTLRHLRKALHRQIGYREMGYLSLKGSSHETFSKRLAQAFLRNGNTVVGQSGTAEPEWQWVADLAIAGQLQNQRPVLLLDDLGEFRDFESLQRLFCLPCPFTVVLAVTEEEFSGLPEDLWNRCELRADLPAWDLTMAAEYFEWALSRVDLGDIFEPQAIVRIHELGNGLPRRMFQIAELGLVMGAVQRVDRIAADLIDQVSSELPELPSSPTQRIS